jgi:hypothetical protein
MTPDIYVEWLRRQGHHVIRSESSYWYDAGPRVFQAFPYHWLIHPSEDELAGFLTENRAIALRYSTTLDAGQGKVSYHVVCVDPGYDITILPRQARQNVRRGFENAVIERIPISRLANEGWTMRRDSLERQGRTGAETEKGWRRMCESAEGLPGFEAWAAISNGELAASFLAFQCEDWYTLPYEQSATASLESRINNAIFYSVTHEAINRPGVSGVFFCLHSLDAPHTVDQFKFRMGLTPRPVCQRVVFHPWLSPFLGKPSSLLVKKLVDLRPNSPSFAKLEGLYRFFLDGHIPPAEQDWPECLQACKSQLLESFSHTHDTFAYETG